MQISPQHQTAGAQAWCRAIRPGAQLHSMCDNDACAPHHPRRRRRRGCASSSLLHKLGRLPFARGPAASLQSASRGARQTAYHTRSVRLLYRAAHRAPGHGISGADTAALCVCGRHGGRHMRTNRAHRWVAFEGPAPAQLSLKIWDASFGESPRRRSTAAAARARGMRLHRWPTKAAQRWRFRCAGERGAPLS